MVYFIDGPNGVGKDYFIDRIHEKLGETLSSEDVTVLRATDFVIRKECSSELRKYETYDTDSVKTLSFLTGHIRLLDEALWSVQAGAKVVLINRGILTLLSYNLYKPEQMKQSSDYLNIYFSFLKEYSRYFDVKFVSLVYKTKATLHENLEVLKSNLLKRNNGVEPDVDYEWFKILLSNFMKNTSTLMIAMPDSVLMRTSSDWESTAIDIQNEIAKLK